MAIDRRCILPTNCIILLLSVYGGWGQSDLVVTSAYQGNISAAWPVQKAVAAGSDGFMRFVVGDTAAADENQEEITFGRCLDTACATYSTQTFSVANGFGALLGYSMALGPGDLPQIAYAVFENAQDNGGNGEQIFLIQCADIDCTSSSNTSIGQGSGWGVAAITVGADGTSYIAYDSGHSWDPQGIDTYSQGLGLFTCSSGSCSASSIFSGASDYDWFAAAVTIGADGNPVIVYMDDGWGNWSPQSVFHYNTGGSDTVLYTDSFSNPNADGGSVGIDVAVGPDGFGRVAFPTSDSNGIVAFVQCLTTDCDSTHMAAVSDPGVRGGVVSVAVPADGNAQILTALENSYPGGMQYIECTATDCSSSVSESVSGSWNTMPSVASLAQGADGSLLMMAGDVNYLVNQVSKPGLHCTPSPVTRAGTITCTATGAQASNWSFNDGNGTVINRSVGTTNRTWTGTMVASGTVSVTAAGLANPLTTAITVNPRTAFAFTAATENSSPETNPYTCYDATGPTSLTIAVDNPPVLASGSTSEAIGKACLLQGYSYNFLSLADNGPNAGYRYVTSASSSAQFHWTMAQDAANPASTFYQAQCGNYDPSSNPGGYISGTQLNTNTVRHESSSAQGQGHYGNYVAAQDDRAANLGVGLEAAANVSADDRSYNGWVTNQIAPRVTTINDATFTEPPDVNHDQNGVYDGGINFAPYAPCH